MTALKTFEIGLYAKTAPAPRSGYYAVWLAGASYPVALHNMTGSTEWRRGAQLVPIDYYVGPLPERRE